MREIRNLLPVLEKATEVVKVPARYCSETNIVSGTLTITPDGKNNQKIIKK